MREELPKSETSLEIRARPSCFQEVYPVWRDELWPGRRSLINSVSPLDPEGNFLPHLKGGEADFWVLENGGSIVGTISGYATSPSHYRSRGLYLAPAWRGRGLSSQLLRAVAEKARSRNHQILWTLPRQSAWPAYRAFGFRQASSWSSERMEFGPNCLAVYSLASP